MAEGLRSWRHGQVMWISLSQFSAFSSYHSKNKTNKPKHKPFFLQVCTSFPVWVYESYISSPKTKIHRAGIEVLLFSGMSQGKGHCITWPKCITEELLLSGCDSVFYLHGCPISPPCQYAALSKRARAHTHAHAHTHNQDSWVLVPVLPTYYVILGQLHTL